MSIPEQVQAAADRADEAMKQIAGDGAAENEVIVSQADTGTAAGDGAIQSTASTTEIKPNANDAITAEIESLSRLNRSLDNENRHLKIKCSGYEREIGELKAKVAELEASGGNVGGGGDSIELTPDEMAVLEEEGLSESAIKILTKRAAANGNPKIGELEQKVETIAKSAADLARDRFFLDVEKSVPDWEAVNVEPGFVEMMNERVPYQDYTFQDLMNNANSRNDSATVAKIFNDYKSRKQASKQPTNDAANPQKRKTLGDIVEPTPTKTVVLPVQNNDEKWSGDKIKDFYADVQRNPKKYTPQQIAEIEKKHIFRA